jgi:hypothetical protein
MKFKESYTLDNQEMLQAVLNYLTYKGVLRSTPPNKVCTVHVRGVVSKENHFEVTYNVIDKTDNQEDPKDEIEETEEVKEELEEKKEGRFLRPEKEAE